jgi:hypothetical protein
MAKQTFSTGQVLTAAQMTSLQQTAMGGGAATAKTASYVLVAADAGTTVAMNAAGATTITVNTALFAAGDTVFIQNLGAGLCTVTAGTATVSTAGSLILPQYDAGILYFTSASTAIFYDYIQTGATSPLTTKGDLYTFGTSDTRLGVGANGTTLVADSSEATGLKWATPAGGGGMTLISETVASTLSSLSFTSLGSYKQLMLMWAGIRHSTTGSIFGIRFNNDSNNIYVAQGMGMITSATTFAAPQGDQQDQLLTAATIAAAYPFGESASLAAGYTDVSGFLLLDNPTSTTKAKNYSYSYGYYNNATSKYNARQGTGYFDSTTAVTSIDIFRTGGSATFSNQSNSTIRLYGVN